jgi:glutamyl-tRNA(Gln) amidotransferase subunit E
MTAAENHERTRRQVGYVPRSQATVETYRQLGFKCGLEIHQQLLTRKKLFCHCPAGIYQAPDDYDAELVRHMRPTLSELGEYDGTALMEFRTRKNIVYRIKNETACTYDIDDTPPFRINPDALDIAIEIALMLKTNIVGELHITRKQYLDGSIPTGFQRTAIVGIEGEIPLSVKKIRIIQISIEEDSCREISDIGHWRTYSTDRLGTPLIEMVTYPDMLTPDEAAEAANYLRFLTRSSGKVRTGIGAAREDVNVSVTGGTRVEIKGVAHIRWIPELTHNEAYRQWALLQIAAQLGETIDSPREWKISHREITPDVVGADVAPLDAAYAAGHRIVAVNLPYFADCLSYFTGPGRCFADEISDRLKVIACLDKPNMTCSEALTPLIDSNGWTKIRELLCVSDDDAQVLFWAPEEDVATALLTIEERCQLALAGVPNETRKSLADGTTVFERVLPGPDRMYPDTDSAPIPITEARIQAIRTGLAVDVCERSAQLQSWKIPAHVHPFLLRYDLVPIVETIVERTGYSARLVAGIFGHELRYIQGQCQNRPTPDYMALVDVFTQTAKRKLTPEILKEIIPIWYRYPSEPYESLLEQVGYHATTKEAIWSRVPEIREEFVPRGGVKSDDAEVNWIMGQLRRAAIGNMLLADLRRFVAEVVSRG